MKILCSISKLVYSVPKTLGSARVPQAYILFAIQKTNGMNYELDPSQFYENVDTAVDDWLAIDVDARDPKMPK
jgi:hypothetical protein